MFRSVRKVLGLTVVAAVASAGFLGAASAPAGADAFGYTIQVQAPLGGGPRIGPMCRLAKVDLASGAITPIGAYLSFTTYACAHDLAFSPGGVLYGIADSFTEISDGTDSAAPAQSATTTTTVAPQAETPATVHLVRFDTGTGAVTDLGAIGTSPATLSSRPGGGITFDAAGNLWVYMIGNDPKCAGGAFCLYQVDPANPANATFKGDDPGETYLFGLTADCGGRVFTVEDVKGAGSGSVGATDDVFVDITGTRLDRVDPALGKATGVGAEFTGGRRVQSLDFGADGVLYGIGGLQEAGLLFGPGYLFVLDPATGVATTRVKLSVDSKYTQAWGLAVSAPACSQPAAVVVTPNFTG